MPPIDRTERPALGNIYARARSRAATRLQRLHHDEFRAIYAEELAKEDRSLAAPPPLDDAHWAPYCGQCGHPARIHCGWEGRLPHGHCTADASGRAPYAGCACAAFADPRPSSPLGEAP